MIPSFRSHTPGRASPALAASVLALLVGLGGLHSFAGQPGMAETGQVPNQALSPPPVMLAEIYRAGSDPADFWVSEKLDGVRAWWDGTRLITRGGRLIHTPEWFTAGFPRVPLDGELWMGRGTFEALSGTVRRLEPDEAAWRRVRYLAFDLPAHPGTFGQRLAALRTLLAAGEHGYLEALEQFRVGDEAALREALQQIVMAGGEGLMLHRDGALHQAGRTNNLLKLKPWQDAEARVVGHLPGKGRLTGMMGALVVETDAGLRLRLGTGFTDEQRHHPPPLGSTVTFRYQGLTANGTPRFASFLRLREEP